MKPSKNTVLFNNKDYISKKYVDIKLEGVL